MAKEFQEPEEKELDNNTSDAEIIDDFNPLDEAIIEKAYTKPNVRFNQKDMVGDIPEPSFIPPPMGGAMNEEEKIKKPQEPLNREMNDLPKKDKHDAADKVAKMIMSGYKMANDFVDKQLLFNEKKIAKMQMEGEIDLSVEVPISQTQMITAGEFIQEFNQQSEGTITVTKEFEEEVTPILTRVLEKRGIGMTDEQYLIYLFGKDIAVKGFMVSQSLSAKKEMLNMLKEATMTIKAQGIPTPQQPQQPTTPTPQPTYTPTQPEYVSEEIIEPISNPYEAPNVNDIVNEMIGSKPKQEQSTQPKTELKILSMGDSVNGGKRGRPKKKK
jgi:hypothetical protein